MKHIGLFIGILFIGTSCSEPPTPSISLQDRQLIDSLYQMEYELLVDTLDAQCEQLQAEQLALVVDSLLKVRIAEIIRQKQRYQKREN